MDTPFPGVPLLNAGLIGLPRSANNGAAPQQDQPVPEEPKIGIKDSQGLKSGRYSKKHIEGIIAASKAVGADPYQALALGLQESGLGTAKLKRRLGKVDAPLAMVHDFEPAQQKELEDTAQKTGIDPEYLKLAIVLRDKVKYGKQLGFTDEASQLQAYNGYGTIKKAIGGPTKMYGVDIGDGLDMKKNPLYGKRLVALKYDIANNPEIRELIEGKPDKKVAMNMPEPNPLSAH